MQIYVLFDRVITALECMYKLSAMVYRNFLYIMTPLDGNNVLPTLCEGNPVLNVGFHP